WCRREPASGGSIAATGAGSGPAAHCEVHRRCTTARCPAKGQLPNQPAVQCGAFRPCGTLVGSTLIARLQVRIAMRDAGLLAPQLARTAREHSPNSEQYA